MYPNQPQYPAAPGQPQYPAAPQQAQYPAAPAPQQFPQQPQAFYPQAPVPPQPYYPQAPVPQQPMATGSLDSFFNQPSTGGGKSLSFETPGTTYVGIVTRPITNGDITQQTDTQGRPQFFKDGRPKFVMKVPLQMQPNQAYPDGLAQWYVKGAARDELVRAMSEAGAPEGPPEAGAVIQVTFTGTRPAGAGMNPAKLFRVEYRRPNGAQPAPAPQQVAAPMPQPAPVPAVQQPAPQAPAPAQQPVAVQQPMPPAPAPAAASELSPEQQQLLAQLTGGTTG